MSYVKNKLWRGWFIPIFIYIPIHIILLIYKAFLIMYNSKRDWLDREIIPTNFNGLSFMDGGDYAINTFEKVNNNKKWEMGYWIELQALRRGANMGMGVGIVLGVILAFILSTILR